jgi:hypothetical protein
MPKVRILSRPDLRKELDRLRTRDLNFEPGTLEDHAGTGWFVDDYRQPLAPESPGPPVMGGSWEAARELSRSMEFLDPSLVRAFYDAKDPFVGRTMVLEVQFFFVRIYAGVRVGGSEDRTRTRESPARIWTWNYQTLEDHFEVGQIEYEVWKFLETGEVEFRIHALSKPAEIDHLFVRLGFRLFGRSTQTRFARRACERMAKLTAKAVDARGRPPSVPV